MDKELSFRVWEGHRLVFAYDYDAQWCKENVIVGRARPRIKPNALYLPRSEFANATRQHDPRPRRR